MCTCIALEIKTVVIFILFSFVLKRLHHTVWFLRDLPLLPGLMIMCLILYKIIWWSSIMNFSFCLMSKLVQDCEWTWGVCRLTFKWVVIYQFKDINMMSLTHWLNSQPDVNSSKIVLPIYFRHWISVENLASNIKIAEAI